MPDHDTATAGATRAVAAFPQRPEDRLRLALRRLEEAIGEQSMAAASLRDAVGELARGLSRLGRSVEDFRGALDSTAREVARARVAARRLEATAARMVVA